MHNTYFLIYQQVHLDWCPRCMSDLSHIIIQQHVSMYLHVVNYRMNNIQPQPQKVLIRNNPIFRNEVTDVTYNDKNRYFRRVLTNFPETILETANFSTSYKKVYLITGTGGGTQEGTRKSHTTNV